MRVTDSMRYRQGLTDLGDITEQSSRLLQQSGTGLRITKPSDDPSGAMSVLRHRRDLAAEADSERRLKVASDAVTTSELAINDSVSIFERAKELAVEGAAGQHADVDFEAIATEADQLLSELVSIGNRQTGNTYIFGGTKTTTVPFSTTGSPVTAVTYNGNATSRTVTPSPGLDIQINMPGDTVFTNGTNAFQTLIDLRDAARNHDVNALSGSVLNNVDKSFDQLVAVRTRLGTISSSLDRAVNNLGAQQTAETKSLSDVEDADLIQTLVDLQAITNRRQAALQAIAKTMQTNLFDVMA